MGEYDSQGALVEETVWLGDLPVANLRSGANFYIAPDHLGSPHQITNANEHVVWLWDPDPFGDGAPKGSLAFNLRFPGQYFDAETGLKDWLDKGSKVTLIGDPFGLAWEIIKQSELSKALETGWQSVDKAAHDASQRFFNNMVQPNRPPD